MKDKVTMDKKIEDQTTYFGLKVYKEGVKESDIKKLPFYEFWEESARGSTSLNKDDEIYIYLHDWVNFCKLFIKHGTHHYQSIDERE